MLAHEAVGAPARGGMRHASNRGTQGGNFQDQLAADRLLETGPAARRDDERAGPTDDAILVIGLERLRAEAAARTGRRAR